MKGILCVRRSYLKRSFDRSLIGFVTTLLVCLAPAFGAEEISSFHSEIGIQPEGLIQVTETIAVVAEGRSIRRGIFRDIPTLYKNSSGRSIRTPLSVLEVTRDGHPERWAIEDLSNGIRIKIGNPSVLLKPGKHRYTISYTTERQIGFFENYDELYWNVTGNGWAFPIKKASCTIHLPQGADVLQTSAWTGVQGSRDKKATMKANDTTATFETTHSLAAREGLTVAVSWPKGYVKPPSSGAYFLDDHGLDLGYALATIVGFIFFVIAWMYVGRDPRKGTIVPLFSPPEDLSPAAVRQIQNMGFDDRAFSAALISLAVKGYLTIAQEGRLFNKYELIQTEKTQQMPPLPPEEQYLYETLFASKTVVPLKKSESETLAEAQKSLSDTLGARYDDLLYKKNVFYTVMGFSIMVVIIALSILLFARGRGEMMAAATSTVIALVITNIFGLTFVKLIRRVRQQWNMRQGFKALLLCISILFLFGEATILIIGIAIVLPSILSPICAMCVPIMALIPPVFYPLMKAPTILGRRLMDKIDGFAMYLQTTEEERLNALNPPERTPELFERYLPYALALGLEQHWGEAFEAVLARAATTNGEGRYSPHWYSGTAPIYIASMGDFASSLGQSFASAAASAATPPGSSSGFSGGGGSSGGGGGGGGGGGW